MSQSIKDRNCRIVVTDSSSAIRTLIADVIRQQGFKDVTSVGSLKDAYQQLESEEIKWILAPISIGDYLNALQMLKCLSEFPKLRQVRVSLFLEDADRQYLPLAFEYGLFSYHPKLSVRDHVQNEMRQLLEIVDSSQGQSGLVAGAYLHKYLTETKQVAPLVQFAETALKYYPGHGDCLLRRAEALFVGGQGRKAFQSLLQAEYMDDKLHYKCTALSNKYLRPSEKTTEGEPLNALGVNKCIVVESDSVVAKNVKEYLLFAGIPKVEVYDNGEDALNAIESQTEVPDLVIQEWRLPKVSGAQLIQRLKANTQFVAPIVVMSSLIKKDETPLVREMGVAAVIQKPFNRPGFFKELTWALQQAQCPTEQKSFEQKIRSCIAAGQLKDAQAYRKQFLAIAHMPQSAKHLMTAEIAFAAGKYPTAKKYAGESLKLAGDTLMTLNLIAKCFMKMRDFTNALVFFEKAQSLSPHNIERLCSMAEAHSELGQKNEANAALDAAYAKDPENEKILEADAKISLATGQIPRAKRVLKKIEGGLSEIISFMNNRAVALTRSGRVDDGIKLYEDTLASLPDDAVNYQEIVRYNLALAFIRASKTDEAKACLEFVSESTSESKFAQKLKGLQQRLQTGQIRLNDEQAASALGDEDAALVQKDTSSNAVADEAFRSSANDDLTVPANDPSLGVPGEMGCYLIFKPAEPHPAQVTKVIETMPRLWNKKEVKADKVV